MYKGIFSFMFICIFALACIASVSALDVNASDDTFSLDDADFSDLSSNSESLAQNSSASEAESLVGGGGK